MGCAAQEKVKLNRVSREILSGLRVHSIGFNAIKQTRMVMRDGSLASDGYGLTLDCLSKGKQVD